LAAAFKNERLRSKLSKLICYSPSEWWTDEAMNQWTRVFSLFGKAEEAALRILIKSTCWWDDVATNVQNFPSNPFVYHWHPVAFLEQMSKMDIPFLFPLRQRVDSYKNWPGRFRDGRDDDGDEIYERKHAGCDLYAPVGTEILAVKDGQVLLGPVDFYKGTCELQIDHGEFIARYCEIQSTKAPGIEDGALIKQGQVVGYIGQLKGMNKSMLHFELYSKESSGNLTNRSNAPYQRRSDLMDPTPKLDAADFYE
jgi:murein DD-endopeptidase MepM/ murein hydrolase activator NlpD